MQEAAEPRRAAPCRFAAPRRLPGAGCGLAPRRVCGPARGFCSPGVRDRAASQERAAELPVAGALLTPSAAGLKAAEARGGCLRPLVGSLSGFSALRAEV